MRDKLRAAKDEIDIAWLWSFYGFDGKPSKQGYSPFRNEKKPSFSVYDDGKKWKDHGTGQGGDQADFVAAAEGIPEKDGIRRLIEIWENGTLGGSRFAKKKAKTPKKKHRSANYELSPLTDKGISMIVSSRKLPDCAGASLRDMSDKGLLFDYKDASGSFWAISDSTRLNVQIRRYDGAEIELESGVKMKAKTLPFCLASWPIGLRGALDSDVIQFCEGGPDFLCGKIVADMMGAVSCCQICFTGSSNSIPDPYLSYFEGKRVVVYQHSDLAGIRAVRNWRAQLSGIAEVHVLRMAQFRWGCDLNDLLSTGELWKFKAAIKRQLMIEK